MIDINLIKNIAEAKRYKNGQTIIQEGDSSSDALFIILKGRVSIYKNRCMHNEIKTAVLNIGDFFGEKSFFTKRRPNFTAVADDDLILIEIDRKNANAFFEKQPAAAYEIMKELYMRCDSMAEFEPSEIPDLFPKEHDKYNIEIIPAEPNIVYEKSYTCPLCGNVFTALTVKNSALILLSMDKDFRPHHKGIDTLYYEVIVCSKCLYSAFSNIFNEGMSGSKVQIIEEKLKPYKAELRRIIKNRLEINSIFTGLYLSLKYAPYCFIKYETITARIWMKLSWLYHDCNNDAMEQYALKQAQKAYLTAFERADIQPDQMQQLYLAISEISIKIKDIKTATHFLFLAKTCKPARQNLTEQANDRIQELKILKD